MNQTPPFVTFQGAAQTVTGSMHLLEANGQRVLLDCGLFQGRRAEARRRNSTFPWPPSSIHAVIVSHAHIDHIGNLPNLVRQGFFGRIYCTPATRDLCAVMLEDSAEIQAEDAAFLNKHREPGQPEIEPLYTDRDVRQTMRLMHAIPYETDFDVKHAIEARFVDAGHLLGSAMVHVTIRGEGGERSLTFTGDVGRRGMPILRDPAPVPPADLLISECTYGGRTHPPTGSLADTLADVVTRTVSRGGKILVPAFSLGRTQTIVYFLHQLIQQRRIPDVPIFVDSPLSMDATEVFRLHPECFDEETAHLLALDPEVFGHKRVQYLRSAAESKRLNGRRDPCIIIAASGMCETGRIVHHLAHNIEDGRNTILIIGYQAPETLGRRIVERRPRVRLHGRDFALRAEVVVMNGFSSHADHGELLEFLKPLVGQVQRVRLVHTEEPASTAFAAALRAAGFADVEAPKPGDQVSV
jgi:metallo-beta-lactamase family protein